MFLFKVSVFGQGIRSFITHSSMLPCAFLTHTHTLVHIEDLQGSVSGGLCSSIQQSISYMCPPTGRGWYLSPGSARNVHHHVGRGGPLGVVLVERAHHPSAL